MLFKNKIQMNMLLQSIALNISFEHCSLFYAHYIGMITAREYLFDKRSGYCVGLKGLSQFFFPRRNYLM